MGMHTYESAGVDVSKGESFVKRLVRSARRKGHDRLWDACGGYATVYPVTDDRAVALSTDGVGTKLLVALKLGVYNTIGIDLVAMCANDLICTGAVPTVFLDYYASGKLEPEVADAVIAGILEGCDQAGMILGGGETAELPGLYSGGHFDLAGFAVGEVSKSRLITGAGIEPGHSVIGIASGGIHSNGLSLARKVLDDSKETAGELLRPTLVYVRPVLKVMDSFSSSIKGMAHITGGGWRNLFRLHDSIGFVLDNPLPVPGIFSKLSGKVEDAEMYRTFNMGMGFCLIADSNENEIVRCLEGAGLKAQIVGRVTDEKGVLKLTGSSVVIRE